MDCCCKSCFLFKNNKFNLVILPAIGLGLSVFEFCIALLVHVHLIGIAFAIVGMATSAPFLWIGFSKWKLLKQSEEALEKTEE